MKYEVSAPNGLYGTVEVPASKSFAHRIIIAAALSDRPTLIRGRLSGKDAEATLASIQALGGEAERIDKELIKITPIERRAKIARLDANESGSTLRFLLPVAACLGVEAHFVGAGRLAERPISPLIDALCAHGISASGVKLPLTLKGKAAAGDYYVDGGISSQYISGLLLGLPLFDGDSRLTVGGAPVSESYIEITLEVLRAFGIKVERTKNIFYIKGGQSYRSPAEITCEADWSSACFFAVGGALSGRVSLKGLNPISAQGDREVVELLKKMGADITEYEGVFSFGKGRLKAIEFSAEDFPDIVPVMAIAAAAAEGTTEISGAERLRLKESDRITAVISMLAALNIKAEYDGGTLKIYGGRLSGGCIDAFNDHRIAMSAAVGAAACGGKVVIEGAESADKSYPQFFEDYKKLGGIADVL